MFTLITLRDWSNTYVNLQVGEEVRIELEVVTTILIAIIMDHTHQYHHPTHALTCIQVTQLWGERMIRSAVVHPGLILALQLTFRGQPSKCLTQASLPRVVLSTRAEPSVSFTNRS